MAPIIVRLRRANPSLSHAETLKQAYAEAEWSNETTRATALERRDRDAADKRAAEAKAASLAAVKAGGSVTGSPGVARVNGKAKPKERRSIIRDAYHAQSGEGRV